MDLWFKVLNLRQKMNSEDLNGWKKFDEKNDEHEKKLTWVNMKGPHMGLQRVLIFVKMILPYQENIYGYHKP